MKQDLVLDPEFSRFVPPLTPKELELLKESILREGCRDAIVTWNGVILDGHNRYAICTEHNIPFQTRELLFDTRDEAIAWICCNQMGRRNLTDENKRYLIGKRYDAEKRIGARNVTGKNQHSAPEVSPRMLGKAQKYDSKHGIASALGSEYRLSHATVEKYGRYAQAVDRIGQVEPGLIPHIMSGSVHIGQDNTIDLSKLSDRQIRAVAASIPYNNEYELSRDKIIDILRRDKASAVEQAPVDIPPVQVKSVKDMPTYDPDAEISSLALTIPSWRSSIERARNGSNMDHVSGKAKAYLVHELTSLRNSVDLMLSIVQE